jgi:hypothetical protein
MVNSARRAGERDLAAPFVAAGQAAVREAISRYRSGGTITQHDQLAWLAVSIADLRIRDDAWARMDPRHRARHRQLWTDVLLGAATEYVPAPASLLAFTAWQSGDGALASVAIDRALAADPDYSMALLLNQAIQAGLPPSAARLPMTPEEVAASYTRSGRGSSGRSGNVAGSRGSSARGSTARGGPGSSIATSTAAGPGEPSTRARSARSSRKPSAPARARSSRRGVSKNKGRRHASSAHRKGRGSARAAARSVG